MKNYYIFFLFLFSCILCDSLLAQVQVDSLGRVIFGKQAYGQAISIVDETTSAMSFKQPLRLTYKANEMITLARHSSYGVMFDPSGAVVLGYNLPAYNLSYTPLEVYAYSGAGGIKVYQNNSYAYPGVNVFVNHSTTNAYEANNGSNRIFHVNGNGIVYSNGTSLTSDIRLKSDIETIQSPLDKLLQLRGVTFRMNFPKTEEKELSAEEAYKLAKSRTPELTLDIWEQIQKEKERKQMGVIAQEVEKVIPEIVRTREDGLKSVSYSEMTGLLIEAIKELKTEIDELKAVQIANGSLRTTTSIDGNLESVREAVLYQNTPNPFTEQTEIRYSIPANVKQAFICIFDMQGTMLKKIDVVKNSNQITIQGSEFAAGMYLYSLVVDGKEVDTKRMILTK
jgi:hypothetical protein